MGEETARKSEGFYKQTRGFPQPPRTKSGMIGTQKVFTSTWSWTCPNNINPEKNKNKMENVVHFMDMFYWIYPISSCFSLDADPSNPAAGWPADEAANKSPRPREGCVIASARALDHRKKVVGRSHEKVCSELPSGLIFFGMFTLLCNRLCIENLKVGVFWLFYVFFGHGRSPCSIRKTTYKYHLQIGGTVH